MDASLSIQELNRLRAALKENYSQAAELRSLRAECIRLYAGTSFPDIATDGFADYVNKMRQSALAQVISLAAGRPRALVTTHNPDLKAWAKKRSRALDAYAKSLRLERILQRCAFGGFFGLGVAKVAMLDSPVVNLKAAPFMEAGRPGVLDISLDHLCWDMDGADFDCVSFIADRYRVRYQDAINDARFPVSARAELRTLGAEAIGVAHGQDWAENIAKATTNETARFEDWVYFTDVFIQSRQCIYTFGCDSDWNITTGPLFHLEWHGKPTGPYSFFSLGHVPGSTKPSSPAQNLKSQHNLINTIYRKLRDQIDNCKDVFLALTGQASDTMRIRSAKDQEIVELDNAQGLKRESLGGPNQTLMGVVYKLEDVYDESSGNLKNRLGLGPSAETLGQEGIISHNAGGVTAYEQGLFADFVSDIYRELLGLLERDSTTTIPMSLTIPGAEAIPIPDNWDRNTVDGARGGDPAEFDVEIDPQSLPYKSSAQMSAECDQLWTQMLPQWQLMAQSGVQPDMATYLDNRARLTNNTFVREMFKFNQPRPDMGPAREPAQSSSNPNKPGGKYTHTSVSANKGDKRGEILSMMAASAADNRN